MFIVPKFTDPLNETMPTMFTESLYLFCIPIHSGVIGKITDDTTSAVHAQQKG